MGLMTCEIWLPESMFCTHEEELLKLDGHVAALQVDGMKNVLLPAYTRSEKLEFPTWIPGFLSPWFRIQLTTMENNAGSRMQPCLTPKWSTAMLD